MMKNQGGFLVRIIFLTGLLLSLFATGAWFALLSWAEKRPIDFKVTEVFLEKNEPLESFAEKLENLQLVTNRHLFTVFVKLKGTYQYFQAGKYRFTSPSSVNDIIDTIRKGKNHNSLLLSVTIPEGFNLSQIIERANKYNFDSGNLWKLARDKDFLSSYNIKAKTAEGFLYPATYLFYNHRPTDKEFLGRMIKEFFRRLPKDYESSLKKMKISLEKAVNIASLIEKESAVESEKPLISEIVWRRLRKGMPLGIDAALIYGIKDYKGDITFKHLKDKKNLYNTRTHKGLPPTPICSPSTSSLSSVINPSNYGYLYYVLLPGDGQKRHQFSKTLREHNLYVKK